MSQGNSAKQRVYNKTKTTSSVGIWQPHSMEAVGHTKGQLHQGCLCPAGGIKHQHEAPALSIDTRGQHHTIVLCAATWPRDEGWLT